MNILFGIWRPSGPAVRREELKSMAEHTIRFSPDGEWLQITPDIGLGVQAQYTHARSRMEVQPARDSIGNMIVYDGRLDNYRELARQLDLREEETADSQIILRAYERWGKDCFVRLIGDWALILWDGRAHALYLARDHAGSRTLHYSRDAAGTTTCATFLDSYLNTSVLDALDPVYMSSYLASMPCYGRTPYRDVRAVLPGHFVVASEGGIKAEQFWLPSVEERRTGNSIEDLKAEFLHLLEQSVQRRTPPGAPALAQLSGGTDSTSIVCVADGLRHRNTASQGAIETLSYFDDSDPAWNERPYFTLVEERRGRTGFHIDVSNFKTNFSRPARSGTHYLYPGIDESTIRNDEELHSVTCASEPRAIISGIGGDEFTGGLANPEAEVAGLLLKGKLLEGVQKAIAWSLDRRISLCEFSSRLRSYWTRCASPGRWNLSCSHAPWLSQIGHGNCLIGLAELPLLRFVPFTNELRVCEFTGTWWFTLRTQPHLKPSEVFRYEYRYPYLDRNLLEFLLRLPADILARPGRRRFLMRSALLGIVPNEILERRRKAFLLSSPLSNIRKLTPVITNAIKTSVLAEAGYVDRSMLELALESIITGKDTRSWAALSRFTALETWIQHRADAQAFVSASAHTNRIPVPLAATVSR
jgi:asparagine synthase (glutamine-hydrolysing)